VEMLIMDTFDKLFEAVSRRDFLRAGKKPKNEPEVIKEPEAPKAPVKKPKAISRRDFIKKTGGGSVLSALTPVDKMLQSWPDIISQVASIANWKSLFNTNILKYLDFIQGNASPEISDKVAQAMKGPNVYKPRLVGNTPSEISDKIIQSITNLVPNDPEYKDKLYEFSMFNKASKFLDKMGTGTITPEELKAANAIISKIPSMLSSYNDVVANHGYSPKYTLADHFFSHSEDPEVWDIMFNNILQFAVNRNLIDDKTLLDISRKAPGLFNEVEYAIDKKDLRKELNNDKQNSEEKEPIDDKQNNKNKEKDKQKNKNKQKNKRKDKIEYSRMDKAGGSEDKQGIDYTTLEHMNKFDKIVSDILQEKKDRCYHRAVQAYGKKTSAYRSAAMVKCRKGKIWKKK